ncbi:Hsp33 family molecular chaperone HslO [Christensenellaceae bacterium OttesenSCG-928-K19]|nr:Hsp33 family molecular chaperone HslO [Christensenellaceae bacterium OttesenSCG-928-K19]
MSDILVKALLNNEAAVYACDISAMAEYARQVHNTLPIGTIILGRTMAAATMMCSTLKNKQDRLTLMINGGGPAGTVIATGGADLKIKAYLANPDVDMPPAEKGGFDIGGAVGKKGFVTVIKDMGLKEPFIGKTRVVTGEIGEDVAQYFLLSEQQPSIVYVNTWLETDMSVLNAGGLIITPMPGCSEKTLADVESRIREITNYAVYLMQESVPDIIKKIFNGMEVKILDEQKPAFECDCSKERLEEVVVSLGEEEIEDMIQKENGAQITCHFCNKVYEFSADELRKLLSYARQSEGTDA